MSIYDTFRLVQIVLISSTACITIFHNFLKCNLYICHYFKNHSENVVFEIINEPYFELNASQVNNINFSILNCF